MVDGKDYHVRLKPQARTAAEAVTYLSFFLTFQTVSNQVDSKWREDLERLKKIRNHRGLRHHFGFVFLLVADPFQIFLSS